MIKILFLWPEIIPALLCLAAMALLYKGQAGWAIVCGLLALIIRYYKYRVWKF